MKIRTAFGARSSVAIGCALSAHLFASACSFGEGGSATGGSANTGGSSGGGSGGSAPTCVELAEEQCSSEEQCSPIVGYAGAPGDEIYAGCRYYGPPDNHITCGAIEICGYPGDDQEDCLLFPDDCLPVGWTRVDCRDVPSCPDY